MTRRAGVDPGQVASAAAEGGIERFIRSFDALLRDLGASRSLAPARGGSEPERLANR
jgi:hypothetical protein